MPFGYLVALDLANRRCVVIGGGEAAGHKVQGLLDAGATLVVVIAEGFTPMLERLGDDRRVELVRRRYRPGDLAGAFIAVAADTDADEALRGDVFREAGEERVLLNAVDDVPHCHFATPAIVRRGDLVVSVSTGGKAPALAKQLRRELGERYGPEFSTLVDVLGEVRQQAREGRTLPVEQWAQRWERALGEDLADLVRRGRTSEARRILEFHLGIDAGAPGAPSGGERVPGEAQCRSS